MKTRAVLFDLDDTLFDHLASARAGVEAFLHHHGREPAEWLVRAWFEIERTHYSRWLAREISFPDVETALRDLTDRRMIVGIITNGNHEQQTQKVRQIGLEPLLHCPLFTSERLGHVKPEMEAFLLPCKSLGLAPAQVLYVGDNYQVDIEGARNAGLRAVHLNRTAGQEASDDVIHSLSELARVLGTLDN